jgi:glycosyltransferase involved in cell wall biosynthesis
MDIHNYSRRSFSPVRTRHAGPQKLTRIPAPLRTRSRPATGSKGARAALAVIGIRGIPANYGGLETCAEQTTASWSKQGIRVLVYCRKNHYHEHAPALGSIQLKHTVSLSFKNFDTLSHTFISILDLLRTERQVEVVHLYNTGNGVFLPLLKLFGKKVMVSGDGLEWKREKWGLAARLCHKLGERMAVWFADEIVVDNVEVQKYYSLKYGRESHLIAYGAKKIERNAVRSADILARHGLEAKKYFIFVGRLVPEKGVHHLIDAYMRLETEMPLVIVGDDVTRSAYRDQLLARRSDRVRFLGFIYGDEYEQLLANAFMYVSASKLEGTSPSLLAAMRAPVCCLVNGIEENRASTAGAVPLFRKNDFDDLRRRWQRFIDEPELAAAATDRGYDYVAKHYRWNAIAQKYLSLIGQLRACKGRCGR